MKNGLVAESMSKGYSLTPDNWDESSGDTFIERPERFGSIPSHVKVDDTSVYSWKVYIDQPSNYAIDISYSYQGTDTEGKLILKMNGKVLTSRIKNTGRTVGEPGNNLQIDSYNSDQIGDFHISEPGYYDVQLIIQPPKNEVIGFQWLWLSNGS